MRQAWQEYQMTPAITKPKEKTVPPVILPIEERESPIESHPLPYDAIIPLPPVIPQPNPIEPIKVSPLPVSVYTVAFFGSKLQFPLEEEQHFHLNSCDNETIADMWLQLSDEQYDPLLTTCLNIRKDKQLCDWAYLLMLQTVSESFLGKGTNEAALLTGYLYCQSGYKMRLAEQNGRLYLLYASQNLIYDQPSWTVDGERFYSLTSLSGSIYICPSSFPKETSLSLHIFTEPLLGKQLSESRTIQSEQYPEIQATISTNKELLKFYETYPTSCIQDDWGSRWMYYANTPASKEMQTLLYPTLSKAIHGLSEKEAVNRLLNWVQTGFTYEYDDKVWGGDRAFFPDETLFYPYCDCEDRSILFSRLVRDLLNLETVLLYYPGHLATAVHFTENVEGDYLFIKGKRFIVCDPTFIYAPVGKTMTGMDNSTAHVILLQ